MASSLFIELLPRLGCGNVVITGDDVDVEDIRVRDNVVHVGERRFTLPAEHRFAEEVTGLRRADNCLSFRLKARHSDTLPCVLDTEPAAAYSREKLGTGPPSVATDTETRIVCRHVDRN